MSNNLTPEELCWQAFQSEDGYGNAGTLFHSASARDQLRQSLYTHFRAGFYASRRVCGQQDQAAKIAELRELVTTKHESKEQFIARVRAVLDGDV